MGRGQQPLEQHLSKTRWQTACRTSASRRSPGGVTAERCLSSVDGDVPGPYPGEDRSSRSRGSDTRVAKRQRRRLLSAPPQVRILPLVQLPRYECPHRLAGQGRRPLKAETRVRIPVGTLCARVRWMDSSSSKRAFAGSNPAGRTRPPRSDWNGRRATNAETGGSNPPGGTKRMSERSSTEECRPDMPETRVRLPPLARETQLLPEASGEAARPSTG